MSTDTATTTKPRFSVTIRDEEKNHALTVEYDSELNFRRSLVKLANVIGTFGLERVLKLGEEFVNKTEFAEKTT